MSQSVVNLLDLVMPCGSEKVLNITYRNDLVLPSNVDLSSIGLWEV